MTKDIVFDTPGAASVLKLNDVSVEKPSAQQVRILQTAIEVNYLDIYQRTGLYNISGTPKIPGVSAVGVVQELGSGVEAYNIGDRVGYATAPSGAYCKERCIEANLLFAIPKEVPDKVAAACLVKGLTAHYLATRVFIVHEGTIVLVHAAAGAVGQLLTQWCNNLGAFVVGTVGSDAKKKIALDSGCHDVINYTTENWVERVKAITNGKDVSVVYDSVGKATINGSLDVLQDMGVLVLYGSTSGLVKQLDLTQISQKSLFFTQPSLFHYKKNRNELLLSATEVFQNLISGNLKVKIQAELPLAEAAKAHEMLESRSTMGSIILIP